MNMEKRDFVPKSEKEIEAFLEKFNKVHAEIGEMLKSGKVYLQDTRDKNGNLKFYRIYKNNEELLYYENVELIANSESELQQEKKPD